MGRLEVLEDHARPTGRDASFFKYANTAFSARFASSSTRPL
ncbi:hypothetical protein F441_07888 [Phytophthora nicotianae CJ01A1]|uniref:Uncharacterized protein n=2 Tax=Phytophthora nicotianae TaxID=4792 RepID=W2KGA5_PHYNI|nr:hypothetical protein L915_12032 [Phytophthora nicotianae]ETL35993.1 hypothetical protein L916_11957 [Phytophthora nicotianae]ETL84261.1 hypothetical protein L917_15883 [Phytophthora nicotianae]ETP17762.1 hypothetical protein F441_07888 [Phytophthora nicotianae CJ01A1]